MVKTNTSTRFWKKRIMKFSITFYRDVLWLSILPFDIVNNWPTSHALEGILGHDLLLNTSKYTGTCTDKFLLIFIIGYLYSGHIQALRHAQESGVFTF